MFRKDSQTILAHFSKAAAYFDLLWLCAFLGKHLNRAVADCRHERSVAFQHTELALAARDNDHVDVFRTNQLFRCYKFKVQWHFLFPSLT